MRARLLVAMGTEEAAVVEVAGTASIGRGDGCTVMLADPAVSAEHARLDYDEEAGQYFLTDLDSLNGTAVDGITVDDRQRLGSLSVITVAGAYDLVFQGPELTAGLPSPGAAEAAAALLAGEDTAPSPALSPESARDARDGSAAPSPAPAPAPAPPAAPVAAAPRTDAAAGPVLRLLGPGSGGRFALVPGDNVVGRSGEVEVKIANPDISRRHAVLRVEDGRVWVRDEGSSNHTFLDDVEVEGETEVRPGARLRFGSVEGALE